MHMCDYLYACDVEMEPTPGYAFTSWDTGYGDMRAIPDYATLRRAAWLDRTALVICDTLEEERDEPIAVSPRNILRKQVSRAAERGFVPYMGSELEFFLLRETYRSAQQKGYANLELRQHYNEDYHLLSGAMAEDVVGAIRRGADDSGIPVEFSKGEASPSQHEINLRYAGAMEMADRHVIYKLAAKEIADSRDAAITFMAKWHAAHAGNSLHIHMSFTGPDGEVVFADEAKQGEPIPGTQAYPSETFRYAVGGLLAHAKALSLLFAPNVNSYKRYMEGTFAPTRIAWSYDNRTVGFRVVGHGASLRIECRIPGGDANPYLAYAGMIAAALDGIENKTDPGPLFEGDGYMADALPRVPSTLNQAIVAFEASTLMRAALGDEVVEHLLHFARSEQQVFDKAVTDYERARYFERI
jgi:glutamine synthetase